MNVRRFSRFLIEFICFFALLCCSCCWFGFILPVAADDTVIESEVIVETQEDTSTSDLPDDRSHEAPSDDPIVSFEETRSVAPVTPSNTSGLKKVLVQLLGNYDPVVVEYSYTSSQGYTSYVREIQEDYPWLCAAAIFAICVYCAFRILGRMINR